MKEWLKVARPANGPTVVTVTLLDENLTVKWAVKANGSIAKAVAEGRHWANKAMVELREVADG